MKCINHPEADAAGPCVKCGTGLCDDCRRELGMKFYCQSCAHEILTQKTTPAATTTSGNARKTIGRTLIMIGIVGAIWSFTFSIDRSNASQHDEMELIGLVLIGIPVMLVSFFMIVIGLVQIKTSVPAISLAAIICGILSLLSVTIFLGAISGIFGLLAIILGAISLARARRNPALGGRKAAIAGLVLGIIGVIASGIWFLVAIH